MTELEGITYLWHEVFGDDLNDISQYLRNYSSKSNRTIAVGKSGVDGMAHCPIFESANGKAAYLYAVAVREDRRRCGIAHAMIGKSLCNAEKNGAVVCLTIPADNRLRTWYASQFGFSEGVGQLQFTTADGYDFGTGDATLDIAMLRVCNLEEYLKIYAGQNPGVNSFFGVEDPIIAENSGTYSLTCGTVAHNVAAAEAPPLKIEEVFAHFPLDFSKISIKPNQS